MKNDFKRLLSPSHSRWRNSLGDRGRQISRQPLQILFSLEAHDFFFPRAIFLATLLCILGHFYLTFLGPETFPPPYSRITLPPKLPLAAPLSAWKETVSKGTFLFAWFCSGDLPKAPLFLKRGSFLTRTSDFRKILSCKIQTFKGNELLRKREGNSKKKKSS